MISARAAHLWNSRMYNFRIILDLKAFWELFWNTWSKYWNCFSNILLFYLKTRKLKETVKRLPDSIICRDSKRFWSYYTHSNRSGVKVFLTWNNNGSNYIIIIIWNMITWLLGNCSNISLTHNWWEKNYSLTSQVFRVFPQLVLIFSFCWFAAE